MNNKLEVANTIRSQIGNRALFFLGAKNLMGTADSLAFRVGRNAKGVNYVVVKLMPSDTYHVEFRSVRGTSNKLKSEVTDVYVDSLHCTIESGTGMYTGF